MGGESGTKARPMHPAWVRKVQAQCSEGGIPFHFKQWGSWCPVKHRTGRTKMFPATPRIWCWDDGTQAIWMDKHGIGRLLDGREYNEFPEP